MTTALDAIIAGAACAIFLGLVIIARVRSAGGRRRSGMYFTSEYTEYMRSGVWKRKRASVLGTTFGRDAIMPWLRANQVDHMSYRRGFGKERPWFELIPLNERTHRTVTALRDAGFRGPTNFGLRFIYGLWFVAYAAPIVAASVLAAHIAHPTLRFSVLADDLYRRAAQHAGF
jgi:hypothetical protein